MEAYPIQNNVFLITGAGANIVAEVGPQGSVLVDAGNGAVTQRVLDAVKKLPVSYYQVHSYFD